MQQRGYGDQNAAEGSSPASSDYAQQQRGFKAQIARRKTFLENSDPDANHDRQAEPQDHIQLLPESALFAEQQKLEFLGPYKSAGNSRGYAQLDQQIDQDEPRFHEVRF